jgi:hypothetical protein
MLAGDSRQAPAILPRDLQAAAKIEMTKIAACEKAVRAARNARYYERKKNRVVCATVEVDETAIDFLQRFHWLSGGEYDTPAIARAIENMLKLSAKI